MTGGRMFLHISGIFGGFGISSSRKRVGVHGLGVRYQRGVAYSGWKKFWTSSKFSSDSDHQTSDEYLKVSSSPHSLCVWEVSQKARATKTPSLPGMSNSIVTRTFPVSMASSFVVTPCLTNFPPFHPPLPLGFLGFLFFWVIFGRVMAAAGSFPLFRRLPDLTHQRAPFFSPIVFFSVFLFRFVYGLCGEQSTLKEIQARGYGAIISPKSRKSFWIPNGYRSRARSEGLKSPKFQPRVFPKIVGQKSRNFQGTSRMAI